MKPCKGKFNIFTTEAPSIALASVARELESNFHTDEEEYLCDYDKGREYEVQLILIPKDIVKRPKQANK